MTLRVWVQACDGVAPLRCASIVTTLEAGGIEVAPRAAQDSGFGLIIAASLDARLIDLVRRVSVTSTVLILGVTTVRPVDAAAWEVLRAGAADVLIWNDSGLQSARQVAARVSRWHAVQRLLESERVRSQLIGSSRSWCSLLSEVVEAAAFSQASMLLLGETGTGKDLLARLIHDLDARPDKGELVVVDCTTLTAELSGSELFGHERGAFTGAVQAREGAVALANRGTLFLDEIGELPLALQAQLLRVLQEGKYKRVGGNAWLPSQFRLICATHRDLQAGITGGSFRADLYYRIAGGVFTSLPLRERSEDILPLALHFLEQLSDGSVAGFDAPVRQYLQTREYPGNVRDLRRIVARLYHRHSGSGAITLGAIPPEERPSIGQSVTLLLGDVFEAAANRAVSAGLGLKQIGQMATDAAVRIAIEKERGSLSRAASRLGVTDRALQLRRANAVRDDA